MISRTVNRDENALESRYDQTGPHVFGLVLGVLDHPTMAEEVTLDVSMQVWRQAGHFDWRGGMLTVMRGNAVSHFP